MAPPTGASPPGTCSGPLPKRLLVERAADDCRAVGDDVCDGLSPSARIVSQLKAECAARDARPHRMVENPHPRGACAAECSLGLDYCYKAESGDGVSQKEALLAKLDTWCRWCKIRAHTACGVFGDSRNRRLLPRELIDSDMAVVCSTSCARRYLKSYGDRSAFPYLGDHLVAVVNGMERSASNVIVPSCSAAPPAEEDVLLDDEEPEKVNTCLRSSRRIEEEETARVACIRTRSLYYKPTGQLFSKSLPEVDLLIVQAYVEERMWEISGREDKTDCWYRMALVVRDRLNCWNVDVFFSKYAEKAAGTCGCYSAIGADLTNNVRWRFDFHPRAWNVSRRKLRPVRSDAVCVSKVKARFSCARTRAQLLLRRTELNHSRQLSKVDMALITLFGKIGTQVAESKRRGFHKAGGKL